MLYEFRVKTVESIGEDWGDRPVSTEEFDNDTECEQAMQRLARVYTNVHEVRWNREGSLQGHYVAGKKAAL